jgi:hypothetical protein
MLASYGFSRTLTPITIGLLLKGERHDEEASRGFFGRLSEKFDRGLKPCGRATRKPCIRC